MFEIHTERNLSKPQAYSQLIQQANAVLMHETDFIANAANLSALLYHSLPDINWSGFYLLKQDELVLGPFQGKPACTRIPLGKGVCGTAAKQRTSVVVPNVHEFPGHIACDHASNAEIVVPLVRENRLLGVLDIDSPLFNRFDDTDRQGLETLVALFLRQSHLL